MLHTTIWSKFPCQFAFFLACAASTCPTTTSASCRLKWPILHRSRPSVCMRMTSGSCPPALHRWQGLHLPQLANFFRLLSSAPLCSSHPSCAVCAFSLCMAIQSAPCRKRCFRMLPNQVCFAACVMLFSRLTRIRNRHSCVRSQLKLQLNK